MQAPLERPTIISAWNTGWTDRKCSRTIEISIKPSAERLQELSFDIALRKVQLRSELRVLARRKRRPNVRGVANFVSFTRLEMGVGWTGRNAVQQSRARLRRHSPHRWPAMLPSRLCRLCGRRVASRDARRCEATRCVSRERRLRLHLGIKPRRRSVATMCVCCWAATRVPYRHGLTICSTILGV